jgi:glycosyltransferase involved in cell wall biosynthesis
VNLLKLSTVIITKNEQQNIARCLSSVKDLSDEILIYDSGSTDETIVIANKMGAKVISGEWLGFGATKHKATDLAKNDWILSIDADEEVSDKLKQEIQNKFLQLESESAYALPRSSFFLGRWIRFGGWTPDYQIRLFNKKYSQWNKNLIHEKVETQSIKYFSKKLNHYVFKNISHQVQTNDRYSGLLAEKMKNEGKKFNWFHFLTKPSVKFIECYFLKLGIFDGYVGFLIAKNAGYSVFLKWAKLKELSKS